MTHFAIETNLVEKYFVRTVLVRPDEPTRIMCRDSADVIALLEDSRYDLKPPLALGALPDGSLAGIAELTARGDIAWMQAQVLALVVRAGAVLIVGDERFSQQLQESPLAGACLWANYHFMDLD